MSTARINFGDDIDKKTAMSLIKKMLDDIERDSAVSPKKKKEEAKDFLVDDDTADAGELLDEEAEASEKEKNRYKNKKRLTLGEALADDVDSAIEAAKELSTMFRNENVVDRSSRVGKEDLDRYSKALFGKEDFLTDESLNQLMDNILKKYEKDQADITDTKERHSIEQMATQLTPENIDDLTRQYRGGMPLQGNDLPPDPRLSWGGTTPQPDWSPTDWARNELGLKNLDRPDLFKDLGVQNTFSGDMMRSGAKTGNLPAPSPQPADAKPADNILDAPIRDAKRLLRTWNRANPPRTAEADALSRPMGTPRYAPPSDPLAPGFPPGTHIPSYGIPQMAVPSPGERPATPPPPLVRDPARRPATPSPTAGLAGFYDQPGYTPRTEFQKGIGALGNRLGAAADYYGDILTNQIVPKVRQYGRGLVTARQADGKAGDALVDPLGMDYQGLPVAPAPAAPAAPRGEPAVYGMGVPPLAPPTTGAATPSPVARPAPVASPPMARPRPGIDYRGTMSVPGVPGMRTLDKTAPPGAAMRTLPTNIGPANNARSEVDNTGRQSVLEAAGPQAPATQSGIAKLLQKLATQETPQPDKWRYLANVLQNTGAANTPFWTQAVAIGGREGGKWRDAQMKAARDDQNAKFLQAAKLAELDRMEREFGLAGEKHKLEEKKAGVLATYYKDITKAQLEAALKESDDTKAVKALVKGGMKEDEAWLIIGSLGKSGGQSLSDRIKLQLATDPTFLNYIHEGMIPEAMEYRRRVVETASGTSEGKSAKPLRRVVIPKDKLKASK